MLARRKTYHLKKYLSPFLSHNFQVFLTNVYGCACRGQDISFTIDTGCGFHRADLKLLQFGHLMRVPLCLPLQNGADSLTMCQVLWQSAVIVFITSTNHLLPECSWILTSIMHYLFVHLNNNLTSFEVYIRLA
jgi:hypothetical protein